MSDCYQPRDGITSYMQVLVFPPLASAGVRYPVGCPLRPEGNICMSFEIMRLLLVKSEKNASVALKLKCIEAFYWETSCLSLEDLKAFT